MRRSAAGLPGPAVAESVVALLIWHRLRIDAVAVAATFLFVVALLASIYWRSIPALIGVAVASTWQFDWEKRNRLAHAARLRTSGDTKPSRSQCENLLLDKAVAPPHCAFE